MLHAVLAAAAPAAPPVTLSETALTLAASLVFGALTWWLAYRLFARGTRAGEASSPDEADLAVDADSTATTQAPAPSWIDEDAPGGEPSTPEWLPISPAAAYDNFPAGEQLAPAECAGDPSVGSSGAESPIEATDGALLDLAIVSRLEKALEAESGCDAVLRAAVGAVREVLDAPAVAAWIAPAAAAVGDETLLEREGAYGFQCGLVRGEAQGDFDGAALFAGWRDALAAGELVSIADPASEPDLSSSIRLEAGSLLLAPFPPALAAGGALALAWPSPLAASAPEAARARILAVLVGAALARARTARELTIRRTQVGVLVDTGRALSRARDLHATLDAILAVVHDRLGYPSCALLLIDEERGDLYVASAAGHEEHVGSLRVPLASQAVTATAVRRRATVRVPDVESWDGYVPGSSATRSEIALPLLVDGNAVGVLDVASTARAAFGERDRVLLEVVAQQAALVLSHARLLSGLEARASQLQVVNEMARAMAATLDARSLCQIVVEQVRTAVRADRATLVHIDPEANEARVAATSSAVAIEGAEVGTVVALEEVLRDHAYRDGAVCFADLDAEPTRVSPRLAGSGLRSLVRVPIRIDGKPAGIFTASSRKAGAFGAADIATLDAMAPHVSAALRNARLFEQVERSYRQLRDTQGHLVHAEQLRVLGEMASGVAHNFNNVLGAILGRAQLVRSRLRDPVLAQELTVIEEAALEGAGTVRRLQEFARVRADQDFARVDLSRVVEGALDLTRPRWKERAAAGIAFTIDDELPEGAWVDGQEHELREAIFNVVVNALEAMPQGGTLGLRTWTEGNDVLLEVRDNGIGMSDEVLNRIFHPFYSTKGPRGTGLGLSIAYGIVHRHGGKLDIESRLGDGTTVRVTLPAAHLPERAEKPPASSRAGGRDTATVLVVEDEPAICALLVDLLESARYRVLTGRTGREAVERLLANSVQLVLTDLGMPEMSGWEVARHCRDLYPGLPVVLVTGWGVELDANMVVETGVRGVITKPFAVLDVLRTVDRVLRSDAEERREAA
jgi:signal transduction histidine kinase/CheY-like chemotaxis protein